MAWVAGLGRAHGVAPVPARHARRDPHAELRHQACGAAEEVPRGCRGLGKDSLRHLSSEHPFTHQKVRNNIALCAKNNYRHSQQPSCADPGLLESEGARRTLRAFRDRLLALRVVARRVARVPEKADHTQVTAQAELQCKKKLHCNDVLALLNNV